MFSPLDASSGQSLDEELLEEQEQQGHRQTHQEAGRSKTPQAWPVLEIIDARPTGSVYMSLDVLNVKASRNSFHAARKLKSAVTATAGNERQHHLGEHLKLVTAVQQRCLFEFSRHRVKEAFQHPHAQREGRDTVGENEAK